MLAGGRIGERTDDAHRLVAPRTCRRTTANEPSGAVKTTRRTLPSSELRSRAIANMNSLSTLGGRSCVVERKKMTTTVIPRLLLASASPRRLELLRQAGLDPEVRAGRYRRDAARPTKTPIDYARRLSLEKARAVAAQRRRTIGPSSPPTPSCISPTASRASSASRPSADVARVMLARLSGRTHEVVTAYTLLYNGGERGRAVQHRRHLPRADAGGARGLHRLARVGGQGRRLRGAGTGGGVRARGAAARTPTSSACRCAKCSRISTRSARSRPTGRSAPNDEKQ